jgi:uncharacterized membrane protein
LQIQKSKEKQSRNAQDNIQFTFGNLSLQGARNPMPTSTTQETLITPHAHHHSFRFHAPHMHLASAFGSDWFGVRAEAFARFFGTPTFLIAQTVIVAIWVGLNVAGVTQFDLYPFILLNLAFSLQAAYAAPLILLAQTRQADRDKAHTEADIQHREALAAASEERQSHAAQQNAQLLTLLEQNLRLTQRVEELSQRIETLTTEVHQHVLKQKA